MKYKFIIVSVLLVLLLFDGILYGQDATVIQVIRVDGAGAVLKNDRAKARDDAINDGLRRALEQGIGVFVESNTVVENFQTLEDNVYTKAKGFVTGYKIISEKSEVSIIRVTLDVKVSMGKVVDKLIDLDFLQHFLHKPRIMVLLQEEVLGKPATKSAGETEIIRKFVEKDFNVVDPEQVKKIRQTDQAKQAALGNDAAAVAIGRQLNAEVIIVGKATSQQSQAGLELGGLISSRARLDARVIRCDTGKILASKGLVAPGLDLTGELAAMKALSAAGGKVADYLMKETIRKWVLSTSQGTSITLKVANVTFKQLVLLEKSLREGIRGVGKFHRRSFDVAGKFAEIEVDLKIDPQQFSTELVMKEFPDFEIEVTNLTAQTLDIRFKSKVGSDNQSAGTASKAKDLPLKPYTVITFEAVDKAGKVIEKRKVMVTKVEPKLIEYRWEFSLQSGSTKQGVRTLKDIEKSREYCIDWNSQQQETTGSEPWISKEVFNELKQVGMTPLVVDKYIRKDSIVMAEVKKTTVAKIEVNKVVLELPAIEIHTEKGDRIVVLDDLKNPLVVLIQIAGTHRFQAKTIYIPGYKP